MTDLVRLSVNSIVAFAAKRKPGYQLEITKAAVRGNHQWIELPRTDYDRIRKDFALLCGTGCQLKRTLAWFGIRDDGRCGCSEYAAELDAWGPDECLRRIEEIVEHLREAAAKRGLPFLATAARIAVARAIDAARRDAHGQETKAPAGAADLGQPAR